MKMFVWEYASKISNTWHDSGGVLVLAKDLESARALLTPTLVATDSNVFTTNPDFSVSIEECAEKVFIFPDAGCC